MDSYAAGTPGFQHNIPDLPYRPSYPVPVIPVHSVPALSAQVRYVSSMNSSLQGYGSNPTGSMRFPVPQRHNPHGSSAVVPLNESSPSIKVDDHRTEIKTEFGVDDQHRLSAIKTEDQEFETKPSAFEHPDHGYYREPEEVQPMPSPEIKKEDSPEEDRTECRSCKTGEFDCARVAGTGISVSPLPGSAPPRKDFQAAAFVLQMLILPMNHLLRVRTINAVYTLI
jgi:hypothetical protein